jgi:hypothetical protein
MTEKQPKQNTGEMAGCLWMAAIFICFVVGLHLLLNVPRGYCKCDHCGAAFQMRGGLPGQFENSECRYCNEGQIIRCSKEESGWDDSRMAEWRGKMIKPQP